MNENLGQKNFSFAKDFQNRVDELPRRIVKLGEMKQISKIFLQFSGFWFLNFFRLISWLLEQWNFLFKPGWHHQILPAKSTFLAWIEFCIGHGWIYHLKFFYTFWNGWRKLTKLVSLFHLGKVELFLKVILECYRIGRATCSCFLSEEKFMAL